MLASHRLWRALATMTAVAVLSAGPGVASAQSPGPSTAVDDALEGLPLEGTSWRLEAYRWRGDLRQVGPEVAASMSLRAGKLRGAGGCGRVRGSYGRMGDALAVRVRGRQRSDCPEQSRIVHRMMRAGLERAATFELVDGAAALEDPTGLDGASAPDAQRGDDPPDLPRTRLVIRDVSGEEVLRFEADDVADLEVGEWRLVAVTEDGERLEAVEEPSAFLDLRPDERDGVRRRQSGRLIGSTGCNGLLGSFSRMVDGISFADLELTDAECPADLARQEAAMLAVLRSPGVLLDLPPDRLVLSAPDPGPSLELVSSVPLEGSTWLLHRLRGGAEVVDDTTMRLEGGAVHGEGPCGEYAGRYETDGVFVRIIDVEGSSQPCELERSEVAFLEALRHAVLVERPRGRLELLDASGRWLARFRTATAP